MRMRPAHRADLVVNQQHGGVVGSKSTFMHVGYLRLKECDLGATRP
jgi:hypothetical protein